MRKLRTLCACLLLAAVLSGAACADTLACDCGERFCECFIQLEDEGYPVGLVLELLGRRGYLKKPGKTFNEKAERAVLAFQKDYGLEQTGMIDDLTLSCLVQGVRPGKLRSTEDSDYLGWVPTDGGKKWHIKPTCSKMSDPRKMSLENAIQIGMDDCDRCAKGKIPGD